MSLFKEQKSCVQNGGGGSDDMLSSIATTREIRAKQKKQQ